MKVKLEKWQILFIIGLIIVLSIISILVLKIKVDERVQRVRLDNGDEITFEQRYGVIRTSTQTFDERFTLVSAEETEGQFESFAEVSLPDSVQNVQHFFQEKKSAGNESEENSAEEYDEIWQWETAAYRDARDTVLHLRRNGGSRYVASDRGYMELSFYRMEPQRAELSGEEKGLVFIRSSVQGKFCFVTEFTVAGYCNGKGRYEAEFEDVDGHGTSALLIADNVSREYFIGLLEWVVGGSYPSADEKESGVKEEAGTTDFVNARKEIACRTAAEEIVYKKLTAELNDLPAEFTIDSWYYADGNEYEGQKYNVHCESYVKGYGMLEWYLMMEEDDGKWIEKGTSLRVDPSEE